MPAYSAVRRARSRRGRSVVHLCLLTLLFAGVVRANGDWVPLEEDGIHDPLSPAIAVLQQPREALSLLPPDAAGNQVNWVKALQEGYIEPRANILPGTPIETLDLDIIMKRTGDAAWVRFPHKVHTEWLDCSNCHESIFATKAGVTPMTMLAILSGQYCGRCHGAVSFPLTECNRCHNTAPIGPTSAQANPNAAQ